MDEAKAREMELWADKLDQTNPAMAAKIRMLLDEITVLRADKPKAQLAQYAPKPDPEIITLERWILAYIVCGFRFCREVEGWRILTMFTDQSRGCVGGLLLESAHRWHKEVNAILSRELGTQDAVNVGACADQLREPTIGDLRTKCAALKRMVDQAAARGCFRPGAP